MVQYACILCLVCAKSSYTFALAINIKYINKTNKTNHRKASCKIKEKVTEQHIYNNKSPNFVIYRHVHL